MINVIDLQHSFIIKWIKCVYCNKDASYSYIPVMYLEKLAYDFSVLRSSVDSKKFMGFDEIKSYFWKKALHVWLKFKDTEKIPINEVDDVANQPLWNNAFVQFKNKSLFYRNWLESGYVCVGDLFIEDSLVSLEHIMTFMGPDPRLPLQYYALYNALPAAWRDPATIENMDPHSEPTFRDQRLSSLTTRDIRVSLVKDRICTPCCVNFLGKEIS